jgi:hypothetical protein
MDLLMHKSDGVKDPNDQRSKSPISLKMSRDGSNGRVNGSDDEGGSPSDPLSVPKHGFIYLQRPDGTMTKKYLTLEGTDLYCFTRSNCAK